MRLPSNSLTHSVFSANTFILIDVVLKTAIIFGRTVSFIVTAVDAPGSVDRIINYLKENGITSVEALFLTHGHADHILATNDYRTKLPGPVKTYLGKKDLPIWYAFVLESNEGKRRISKSMTWESHILSTLFRIRMFFWREAKYSRLEI